MTNEEVLQALKRCSTMTWKSWKRCTDCPLAEHCRDGTLEKFLAGRFANMLKGIKRLKGENTELEAKLDEAGAAMDEFILGSVKRNAAYIGQRIDAYVRRDEE